jgi:anti-sigma factor RsiW
MSAEEKHYELEIQDLIDGRLDPALQPEVEAHIAKCEKCKAQFETLNNIKQIVRKTIGPVSTPERLRNKILLQLRNEKTTQTPRKTWPKPAVLTTVAAAVVLLLIGGLIYRNTTRPGLPSRVAKDYQNYMLNQLRLEKISSKAPEIESYFQEKGIPFDTRVFDLSMMEYDLLGGKVHQLSGRPSALFAYEGPKQVKIVCQMFPGSVQELPPGSEVQDHNAIRFYIYQQNRVTMIFWQEGKIICVLASEAQKNDVIQLAFAKAVKV